jgi:ribosomal subunit interface protein
VKLPLQITLRDVLPLPSLEPPIRQRAEKLEHWAAEIVRCHVVVSSAGNRHRQGHEYTVQIELHVPDAQIISGTHHRDQDIYRALAGAFDAADRQLEDHVRKRRGQVKQHKSRGNVEQES